MRQETSGTEGDRGGPDSSVPPPAADRLRVSNAVFSVDGLAYHFKKTVIFVNGVEQ